MKPTTPHAHLFAGGLTLAALLASCTSGQEPEDPARAERWRALRAEGRQAPLTIHPVRVLERPDARLAQALGLVLENLGMPDLAVAETGFAKPPAEWADVPAAFGEHVRSLGGDGSAARHHLYAEVLGTPRSGPTEVRFVLVDAQGQVAIVDRQTPDDPAFRATAGRDPDPLGCCTLVAERLFGLVGWKKAPGSVSDGRFARLWREMSGAPAAAERRAIEARRAVFAARIGGSRIVVLPTLANGVPDADSAQRLVTLLAERFGCSGSGLGADAAIEIAPTSNEQKRLWDLARGLPGVAKARERGGDYSLVVDVGIGPEGAVAMVHVAICDADGEPVVVDFQNDQHPMLQRAAPKTLQDAERFAVERLASLVR
jgi:hypothetical protein